MQKRDIWTSEFVKEMKQRSLQMETKKGKGNSWQEVQRKANAILKNEKLLLFTTPAESR